MPNFFRFLWQEIKNYKLIFCFFIFALTISSLAILALGQIFANIIDQGISLADQDALKKNLNILIVLTIILSIAIPTRFFAITIFAEKIISKLRQKIFSHLLELRPKYFEDKKLGQLVSNISADITILQNAMASSLSILLRNSILFMGSIMILFSLNFKLTLLLLSYLPILIFPIVFLLKKLKKLAKVSQDDLGEVTSFFAEKIAAIKLIQSFNKEDYANSRLSKLVNIYLGSAARRIKFRSFLTAIIIFMIFISLTILINHAAGLVTSGAISAGILSSYIFYCFMSALSLTSLTEVLGNISQAAASIVRTNEIFAEDKYKVTSQQKISKVFPIEFKNVDFSYANQKNLDSLNFSINQGEMVAIVGESGAGKSTLFEILLRFYEINSGSITFANIDYQNFSHNDIRSYFAYVSQDPILFNSSIAENIAFSDEYDLALVEKAAAQAQAKNFIEELTEKYETVIGERGVKLSGGERQRIALARALYQNKKIILFDEVTSNLDSYNEKKLHEVINNNRESYSFIIIAHRLETIIKADRIIVLDQGRIEAIGTHVELLENNKIYQRIFNLQLVNRDQEV